MCFTIARTKLYTLSFEINNDIFTRTIKLYFNTSQDCLNERMEIIKVELVK